MKKTVDDTKLRIPDVRHMTATLTAKMFGLKSHLTQMRVSKKWAPAHLATLCGIRGTMRTQSG